MSDNSEILIRALEASGSQREADLARAILAAPAQPVAPAPDATAPAAPAAPAQAEPPKLTLADIDAMTQKELSAVPMADIDAALAAGS